jgi:hypothetical protein
MMMNKKDKAALLLEGGFLDGILEEVKGNYVELWARETDADKRHSLWTAHNMADDVRRMIVGALNESA